MYRHNINEIINFHSLRAFELYMALAFSDPNSTLALINLCTNSVLDIDLERLRNF